MKHKNAIEKSLEDAGISGKIIKRGDIWTISDSIITFPTDRLPKSKRTNHEQRPVLVLSCDEDLTRVRPLTAIISPVSAVIDKMVTDFRLTVGMGGLKYDSVVRLGLIQPILKIDLKQKIGRLEQVVLDQVMTVLLCNLGVLQRSE